MLKVPLGKKRRYAIIDDEDYKKIVRYRWHESICFAAQRRPRDKDGRRGVVFMHQVILGIVGQRRRVIHINGNRLDNRRENLMLAGK